ncbi:uncharacterized protein A4U43_C01F16070 [Asparagus officinalis]|uniref:Uncharacterized protein n=1 Tax=Asparagus officinalis TaxID=4686 RepID=A0A5P1FPZ9_ASPOF|nr:uncharacterized protein A4U43_C01F16070 [Asparagus officinalis]
MKPTPHSSYLRRVAFVDPDDALLIRDVIRRTRILYESIRTRLLQEDESSSLPGSTLRGDYARLNFPNPKHIHLAGNPLHSSVDAKLQAICQTLESFGKKKVSIESKPELVISSSTVETEESYSSSSMVMGATRFSVSETERLDFNGVPWDDAEDFVLRKYPTYEIDWDSILSSA